jgi:hypothetical protein
MYSDDMSRKIRHDASMPLQTGKIKMRSTRSEKEGIVNRDLHQ